MPARETELLHLGDNRSEAHGAINPPVYRASLFSFPSYQAFLDARSTPPAPHAPHLYSRVSHPTRQPLETKIAFLEQSNHAFALSSGMSAISVALLASLSAGDHLLAVDC